MPVPFLSKCLGVSRSSVPSFCSCSLALSWPLATTNVSRKALLRCGQILLHWCLLGSAGVTPTAPILHSFEE